MATDPRYPIGKLTFDPAFDASKRPAAIDAIAALPRELTAALKGLDDAQLDTPYRDGGWTVRQLVHHLADSHAMAYVRMKLIASEDRPLLQAYNENTFAEMPDGKSMPIDASLTLLDGLHRRMTAFLRGLPPEAYQRVGAHSADGTRSLDQQLQIYSWHGRHHVAHVTALRSRMGW